MKNFKKEFMNQPYWGSNKVIVRKYNAYTALVLQELIDAQSRFNKEVFFKSSTEIAAELNVERSYVSKLIDNLVKGGFVIKVRKNRSNHIMYKLDHDKLLSLTDEVCDNIQQVSDSSHIVSDNIPHVCDSSHIVSDNIPHVCDSSHIVCDSSQLQYQEYKTKNTKKENKTKNTSTKIQVQVQETADDNMSERDLIILNKRWDKFGDLILDNNIELTTKLKKYSELIEDYGSLDNIFNNLGIDNSVRANWKNHINRNIVIHVSA